jgi:hypothetical protein
VEDESASSCSPCLGLQRPVRGQGPASISTCWSLFSNFSLELSSQLQASELPSVERVVRIARRRRLVRARETQAEALAYISHFICASTKPSIVNTSPPSVSPPVPAASRAHSHSSALGTFTLSPSPSPAPLPLPPTPPPPLGAWLLGLAVWGWPWPLPLLCRHCHCLVATLGPPWLLAPGVHALARGMRLSGALGVSWLRASWLRGRLWRFRRGAAAAPPAPVAGVRGCRSVCAMFAPMAACVRLGLLQSSMPGPASVLPWLWP